MLVLVIVIVIAYIDRMPATYFDHEKLRVYQEALRFVAHIEPVLADLSGKMAARDQLDRASTSIVLNIAEGNGKRSRADRCRYLDIARGSALECAACLDVLVIKQRVDPGCAATGKQILVGIVSMLVGLLGAFGADVQAQEEQDPYSPSQRRVSRTLRSRSRVRSRAR